MNKKILYALNLVIAFALIGLVYWYAENADASDILYSEITASTTVSSNTNSYGARWSGVAPDNWLIDRVDIYIGGITSPGTGTSHLEVRSGALTHATTTPQATVVGWNSYFLDTPVNLLDAYTAGGATVHVRMVQDTGGNFGPVYHSNMNLYSARYSYAGGDNVSDPIMAIYGIDLDDVGVNTATRIISQDAPANGDTTSSDVVEFDFTYYNNDTDDEPVEKAGIEVRDMTGGFEYAPEETDINASGEADFGTLMALQENHFHLWRPYLRNASSTRIIYGQWFSFDVVGVSAPFESYIDPETGLPINASSTSFWDFLNVPTLLKTKAPTGYIYQIGQTLSELNEIGATTTPTLTMSFVSASSSMTALKNVDLFSYAIVTQLIPSGLISILRALMVATLYIGLAFGIIHHSHNMFS